MNSVLRVTLNNNLFIKFVDLNDKCVSYNIINNI